ncbi:hypothetical protein Agabi119p4_1008 [Agaricus bisporus var. burnettii]|uniref:Uncharacterized protein n=1 Tax=Agaricus bisporus var. burnettii TaxID=192524 RepID=A0A8H7FBK6_AGABI|nr:hypothetical protein Agabi119p4_1008 [Agaricus bisporus var. burnettii]
MFHHPLPIHPLDTSSHLDLSHTCMSLQSSPSRPKARQVFAKIKQQASAFVKTPTKRLRSRSCTEDDGCVLPSRPAPTVTFAASALVQEPRARSASYSSSGDSLFTGASTSSLQLDASPGCDFGPYIPLALRLEREARTPPTFAPTGKRPVVPPPSPSSSVRSISTTSTHSPVTPVFTHHHHHHHHDDVHPYTSAAAVMSPWSISNDESENQNDDPFKRGKVQIVRRSLVQDSFLLACTAVDDDGSASRSPTGKSSRRLTKKPNAPLPPSKPPPSCPLPSPPGLTSPSSSSAGELVETASTADEEWTLFLGAPSRLLELPGTLAKEHVRERAKSSPSAPSLSNHHHLSPNISTLFQKHKEEESARVRTVSTQSMATTRRIESGPGGHDFEDWTLSLPLRQKPNTSVNASVEKAACRLEVPVELKARKCRSFTDWTMSLSEDYERKERRLAELEQHERQRERKLSHVSVISSKSATSSRSASIRSSTVVKEQRSNGLDSNESHAVNSNSAATKSTTSLHSITSIATGSTARSHNCSAPSTPISPNFIKSFMANPPPYTLKQQAVPSSPATSVSTLGKFPLPPPSFSSKLLQRRQAAPPMLRPLMSTATSTPAYLRTQRVSPTSLSAVASGDSRQSSPFYATFASGRRDTIHTGSSPSSPLSSSADSPHHFPIQTPSPTMMTSLSVPPPSRRKRIMELAELGVDDVSPTTDDAICDNGGVVRVMKRNSSRTASSASTVKMSSLSKQNHDSDGVEGDEIQFDQSRWNSSRKSSMEEEIYETCDEGRLSSASPSGQSSCDVFHSARSSFNV